MEPFDFQASAEVFAGARQRRRRQPLTFRSFATGAEAIRHVMEGLSAEAQAGAVVETEAVRLSMAEIRALYESPDYPLPRRNRADEAKR